MGELYPEMGLEGQVAIVTGASRGLGKDIALALGSHGATVVAVCKSKLDKVREVVEEIKEMGAQASGECINVAAEHEVISMARKVIDSFGKVDILVNCAGVYDEGVLWHTDLSMWNYLLEVNLTGPFLTMKHVIPHMREREYGRIVNVASFAATKPMAGVGAYSASKAGLISLTRVASKEIGCPGDITANVVIPGTFTEGMTSDFSPGLQEDLAYMSAKERAGSPSELSWAVLFFCSPMSGYINGAVLNVDGGM